MADTAIVVINGYEVIAHLEAPYIREHMIWENKCAAVPKGFRKKTSKTVKNDVVYESTSWYRVKPDGGLESVGKEEPDYSKYYPPEPKPVYSFKFQRYQDHIILEEKDYLANQKLFKDCLVFALEECRNYSHPLYANPEKAVNGGHPVKVQNGNQSQQFCMGCGEPIIGSVDGHKCKKKVSPSEALVKINNSGILCSNAEKDENGACSHLMGMNCGVLCCRQCPDDCASRCAVADSVGKGVGISARSPGGAGQKRRTGNRNFDLPRECELRGGGNCGSCEHDDCPCWNGAECGSCEHNDECPVPAEGDDE